MTTHEMLAEAAAFHGERCAGAAMGVKAIMQVMEKWDVSPRDPRLRVWMGDNGCMTDAIQALTGATIGNKRMKVPGGRVFRFALGEEGLVFHPVDTSGLSADEVLQRDAAELFSRARSRASGSP
jgi:hypothetical protein